MPTYRETVLVGTATEQLRDLPKVGDSYPVEVRDGNGRTVFVLHYEDEVSADKAVQALSSISDGLKGLTTNPF